MPYPPHVILNPEIFMDRPRTTPVGYLEDLEVKLAEALDWLDDLKEHATGLVPQLKEFMAECKELLNKEV